VGRYLYASTVFGRATRAIRSGCHAGLDAYGLAIIRLFIAAEATQVSTPGLPHRQSDSGEVDCLVVVELGLSIGTATLSLA
jgi:hypothetical protein